MNVDLLPHLYYFFQWQYRICSWVVKYFCHIKINTFYGIYPKYRTYTESPQSQFVGGGGSPNLCGPTRHAFPETLLALKNVPRTMRKRQEGKVTSK